MFGRRKNYYKPYRGRGAFGGKKWLVITLLLLVVLLAAAAFFVLPEYIVFNSNGFYFTFQKNNDPGTPPAAADDENSDGPSEPSEGDGEENDDFNVVINGRPQVSGHQSTVSLPTIQGVDDDIDNLLKKGYAAGLKKAALDRDCNTLCFEVKGADGVMAIPMVSSYSSQGSQGKNADKLKETLTGLKSDGQIHLAARVSALKDNKAASAFYESALKTGRSTWLDAQNNRWIDPYSDMASDYLCDIISACAASGFDIVIFDDLCFPTSGRTDMITYPETDSDETRREAINKILSAVIETANSENVAVCLSVDADTQIADLGDSPKYCHTIFYPERPSDVFIYEFKAAQLGCDIGYFSKDAFSPTEGEGIIAGYLK